MKRVKVQLVSGEAEFLDIAGSVEANHQNYPPRVVRFENKLYLTNYKYVAASDEAGDYAYVYSEIETPPEVWVDTDNRKKENDV